MCKRKKAISSAQISGINEDGDVCWCGADITSGASWFKEQSAGPDLYVREVRCAQDHTETRKSDGG